MCTSAIRNLIRQNKTHQIYSIMQVGASFGMQTMDQGLSRLVKNGLITESHRLRPVGERRRPPEPPQHVDVADNRQPTKRGTVALTFDYKVRDRSGGLVEGQLEGDSMALVVRRLREMGYMPISVTPKSAVNLKTEIKIPFFSDRIKLREVAVVTRQLSTMVDSGLSVVRSLGILAAQVDNPAFARSSRRFVRISSTVRRCPPRVRSIRRSSHISSVRSCKPARWAGTSTRYWAASRAPSRTRRISTGRSGRQ